MSDILLTWDPVHAAADLSIEANDLAREYGLETAVLISLFTDRRADDGDTLPDESTDRRGWWGDAVPVVEGDQIGSRLWLLDRAKQTPSVLRQAEEFALEALQWLVDDKVAARIEATAEIIRPGVRGLTIFIYRPGRADPARFRYDSVWSAMEA
jgi:phage gp46-like protein